MAGDDYRDSRFWLWYVAHRTQPDEKVHLKDDAVDKLVESVSSGELIELDGVMSPMAERIRARHGLHEFEMNSNWILTSQEWVCPCCGRSKFEISRPGSKNQILAKLVVHHDHMGGAMEEAFHVALKEKNAQLEQVSGARLVERIGNAFASHEEVLVCEDCNNADTEAARLIGSPKHFTFTPNQISRFICAHPHRSHEVQEKDVFKIWNEVKYIYELRMRLITEIAGAAATDAGWFEPYPRGTFAIPIFGSRGGYFDDCVREWISTETIVRTLGPQKNVSKPNLSRWRTRKPQKKPQPLPANYEAMLLTQEGCARSWRSLPNSWNCPICKRNKYETVHWGKNKNVSFTTKTTGVSGGWERRVICSHCTSTLMSLKFEVASCVTNAPTDSYVYATPDELASIIVCSPHREHGIDSGKAAELVARLIRRLTS